MWRKRGAEFKRKQKKWDNAPFRIQAFFDFNLPRD